MMAIKMFARTEPVQVFDQVFLANGQFNLLRHAVACAGAGIAIDLALPGDPLPESAVVCVGNGSKILFERIRAQASVVLGGLSATPPSTWPSLGTLLLIAPDLPSDCFKQPLDPYSEAAFVLKYFQRVVVLFSGHDVVLQPADALGRVGHCAGSDPKVSSIDISGLIEYRADTVYGALCSCEALGLAVRLLRGVALESALTPFAKLHKP